MPKDTFFNIDEEKQQRIIEASLDEFADNTFNEAKLSRIIKESKIPRGSFYQYFEDKYDLYNHLFTIMGQKKMEYMSDLLPNPDKMPFIVLFEELYTRGVEFAKSDPRFIRLSKNLMTDQDLMNKIFGIYLEIAREYYKNYIETDKERGRIRKDVDTDFLADFVLQATTNIAFNEVSKNNELDVERMFNRIKNIMTILKKGIE